MDKLQRKNKETNPKNLSLYIVIVLIVLTVAMLISQTMFVEWDVISMWI